MAASRQRHLSPFEKFYVSTNYISRAMPRISSLVSGADSATLKKTLVRPISRYLESLHFSAWISISISFSSLYGAIDTRILPPLELQIILRLASAFIVSSTGFSGWDKETMCEHAADAVSDLYGSHPSLVAFSVSRFARLSAWFSIFCMPQVSNCSIAVVRQAMET